MKRAQTMFGRVAVVVFAGLALAHALTFAVLLYAVSYTHLTLPTKA